MIREGDIATLTQQRGLFEIGLAAGQQLPREELAKHGYHVTPRGERGRSDCWMARASTRC